ncbi:MAG: DUF6702 family protein [Pseudomonadota bacterium]
MEYRRLYRFFVMAVLFIGALHHAYGHQQKAAITTITFNATSSVFEIVHRFNLHDAEHAVKRILYKETDIYNSADTQVKFAEYIYERFSIADEDGHLMSLVPVGYELDNKHFWVYQELVFSEDAILHIQHPALQEIWAEQINTVNIEVNDEVRTLLFTSEDPHQTVEIAF